MGKGSGDAMGCLVFMVIISVGALIAGLVLLPLGLSKQAYINNLEPGTDFQVGKCNITTLKICTSTQKREENCGKNCKRHYEACEMRRSFTFVRADQDATGSRRQLLTARDDIYDDGEYKCKE